MLNDFRRNSNCHSIFRNILSDNTASSLFISSQYFITHNCNIFADGDAGPAVSSLIHTRT